MLKLLFGHIIIKEINKMSRSTAFRYIIHICLIYTRNKYNKSALSNKKTTNPLDNAVWFCQRNISLYFAVNSINK